MHTGGIHRQTRLKTDGATLINIHIQIAGKSKTRIFQLGTDSIDNLSSRCIGIIQLDIKGALSRYIKFVGVRATLTEVIAIVLSQWRKWRFAGFTQNNVLTITDVEPVAIVTGYFQINIVTIQCGDHDSAAITARNDPQILQITIAVNTVGNKIRRYRVGYFFRVIGIVFRLIRAKGIGQNNSVQAECHRLKRIRIAAEITQLNRCPCQSFNPFTLAQLLCNFFCRGICLGN